MHCHHFFVRGSGAQYFQVQAARARDARPGRDIGFEAAKQELQRVLKQAEEEKHRQITEPEESKEPNAWLRRIG